MLYLDIIKKTLSARMLFLYAIVKLVLTVPNLVLYADNQDKSHRNKIADLLVDI